MNRHLYCSRKTEKVKSTMNFLSEQYERSSDKMEQKRLRKEARTGIRTIRH